MKTLIEVDRNVWGRVKHLATVKEITLNSAVEQLLLHALSHESKERSQRNSES
jgi:macrodomain Ter protein organizer (MatP/YcbG family)